MSENVYERAPEGQIYVCGACGRTSPTRSGYDADGKKVASGSWDEACFLNAVLCYQRSPLSIEPWRAVEKQEPPR